MTTSATAAGGPTTNGESPGVTWDYDETLDHRNRYLTPALATFQAYEKPLLLARGRRQYLWDGAGRKYLDCIAQNLCISVGYCHPLVTEAVKRQLDELQHCTTMWMHPAPGLLGKALVERLPSDGDWVLHFVNSGSEAIDLALLLSRLYTRNHEVVALRRAYHGLHFGAMSATGIARCHQPVPAAPGVLHVSVPDQYRGAYGPGVDDYVNELGATLESSTAGGVAGMLFEPIQGFGGVIPLPAEYVQRAERSIRAAGGVLIADEVQTGFGRTGEHFWGFERLGVTPDIVVMSKGLGNGFPIAAVAARREIAAAMTERKFFNTYGSNPMACAAASAVLVAIEQEGLQENARRIGASLVELLRELQGRHECIGDVRGRGLLIGVDIVADRETREPAPQLAAQLSERMRERGVILSKSGAYENVLRIAPPLCIGQEDVGAFGEAVTSAFAGMP